MSELEVFKFEQPDPFVIKFLSGNGDCAGELRIYKNGKIDFEGDTSESAQILFDNLIKNNSQAIKQAKREAINELLALHEQDRAKVNSQCDTLINMSTVDKYLRGLE